MGGKYCVPDKVSKMIPLTSESQTERIQVAFALKGRNQLCITSTDLDLAMSKVFLSSRM